MKSICQHIIFYLWFSKLFSRLKRREEIVRVKMEGGRKALMKFILKLYNHILTLAGVLVCHVEKGEEGPDEVYSGII